MRSVKFFGFVLVLSLVFVGCRKQYTVTGKVYNAVTNEGLANVEVVFTRNIKTSDEEGKTFSTTTNGLGNYTLNTKANIRKGHKVTFMNVKDTNFFLIGNYEQGLFSRNKEQRVDLAFARIRPQNLYYVDSAYKDISPELEMQLFFRHQSVHGFYLDQPFTYSSNLTVPGSPSYPMLEGWTYIRGRSVRQNGFEFEFIDSIYVNGNSTDIMNHYQRY